MTAGVDRESTARPASPNRKIEKTKLLLGEGQDEVNFFGALLKHLGKDDVQVLQYGGKQKLSGFLSVLKVDPLWDEVEALLITRDSDFPRERSLDPAAQTAWTSVIDVVRSQGLPVPRVHAELYGAEDRGTLRVGVFILPDGAADGMLEDLCLAAAADDPVKPCLDAYFRCIEEKGLTIPRNVLPKARAHAYLASRPIPDKRVGEAAVAGYWPWEAAALAPLLEFVRRA